MAPSAGHSPQLCLQHLGRVVPDSVELLEMICESCMNKNTFLWTYAAHLAGSSSPDSHIYVRVITVTMATGVII